MTKKSGAKIKLIGFEKLMYFILVLIIVSAPMINVFTKAKLSETNIEVEQLKKRISLQNSINEGLSMEINELASLEKIQAIAHELGLVYNDNNVKIVGED